MFQRLKMAAKRGFTILSNPHEAYQNLHRRPFDSVMSDYLVLLIAVSIVAGIVNLIYALLRSVYLTLFQTIEVDYLRLLNYALGNSAGILFFYFFAGTFFLFLLTLILNLFCKGLRMTQMFAVLFYAATPLLLFSWIPVAVWPLLVWSIFLFVIGAKRQRFKDRISKRSVRYRD